eukprot:scaffold674761_cov61-Prasinocladus_malaysianus.AAC.1
MPLFTSPTLSVCPFCWFAFCTPYPAGLPPGRVQPLVISPNTASSLGVKAAAALSSGDWRGSTVGNQCLRTATAFH